MWRKLKIHAKKRNEIIQRDLKNKMLDANLSVEDSNIDESKLCDGIEDIEIEATSEKILFFSRLRNALDMAVCVHENCSRQEILCGCSCYICCVLSYVLKVRSFLPAWFHMFLRFGRFYQRGVICSQGSVIFTCVVSYVLKVRSFLPAWCHMFLRFGRFYLRGVICS